jgi:hypothetical protein
LKITRILVNNKNLKNKKVEFQNTRTALTSFGIHEICQKSGHGVGWVKNKIFYVFLCSTYEETPFDRLMEEPLIQHFGLSVTH